MRLRVLSSLLAASLVATVSGCSFSDSSESISKSISSPFESSSDSSGDSKSAYRNDVRDYTAAYVRSGGQFDAFQSKIGSLAARHGIGDWELNQSTYLGIGEGLRKGGVNTTELAAWKSNLADNDLSRAQLIQQGYDEKR